VTMDALFLWISSYFDESTYLNGLRAGGILCAAADIAATALFVRVTEVIGNRPPARKVYAVLLLFALLTPLQLIPRSTTRFFMVMFLVFLPPYMILIWTAVREAHNFVSFVKSKVGADFPDE